MTQTNQTHEAPNDTNPTTAPSGCCGGAAPKDSGACCALDAEVKQGGGTGCGCGAKPAAAAAPKKGCC